MAQIILDSNNNLIQGDFDNATINNRTKFKTTTTNATTNVYAVPNGSATSAGFTVTNAADPTNASKLTIATNGSTDTQIISGVNGSGTYLPMSFYTNNTLAMQITTGGIISAAGGGIQFPATQITSADANTLDDYEEGTWTPTIDFNGASVGVTYSIQFGRYTKIGNLVNVSGYVALSNKGSSTGALRITNLPFLSQGGTNNYAPPSLWANNMTSITGGFQGYVNPASTVINYEQTNGGASASVTNTNCQNNSGMLFSAVYAAA